MPMRPPVAVVVMLCSMLAVAAPAVAQVARVGGTITNEIGEPIRGVTVTIENEHTTPRSLASVTDNRGRWGVLGLQAGIWTITATAPGYLPVQVRARVSVLRPNAAVDFRMTAAPVADRGPLVGVDARALQASLREADGMVTAGRWPEALAAYQAILSRAPALTLVNLPIGRAQRAIGNVDAAEAAFQEVLKADPANSRAKVELGLTWLDKGDTDGAIRMLRDVIAADPDSPEAGRARAALERLKT